MEFGIYLRKEHTYENMLALAKKADELQYFGAFLNDHVIGFGDDGHEPYIEAWTAMTGIGVQTKNLRIGQIVLFNSLRNPAYLAKSIATLDNMTNGRYELLIGAGWNEREYNGYDLMEKGRGMPSAGERVDRFKESVDILNLMLSQEVSSYNGKYWQLEEAINIPQPVQQPLRLSVGCKGPRMMRITAENADGINLSGSYLPDTYDLFDKFENVVTEYTEKSLDDYFISGFASIEITEDENRIKEIATQRAKDKEVSTEEARENILVGPEEVVIDRLRKLEDRGMDMIVSSITVDDDLSSDKLSYFRDNVITQL